ncbi:MAG: TetR/AcrR family transcriptional regulator [Hyphomicrobiales bacterium]|nr:TetR/AcrR family transcriptional regulator [Hyphomicrobiales bacterium]
MLAATEAVALLGIAASTSRIAKDAGVAEGTLFVYFASKDELLSQLYLDLKTDLRITLTAGYPSRANVEDRFRHLWIRLIEWRAKNPEKREAMRQLAVYEKITEAKRRAEDETCTDIQGMIEQDLRSGALREQPVAFLARLMEGLADMVFEMTAKDGGRLDEYSRLGWEALWGAISPR